MSYTKEFEEWMDELNKDKFAYYPRDKFYRGLSAFVKLVREEAAKLALQACHGVPHIPIDDDYGEAFNSICERFGLEEK